MWTILNLSWKKIWQQLIVQPNTAGFHQGSSSAGSRPVPDFEPFPASTYNCPKDSKNCSKVTTPKNKPFTVYQRLGQGNCDQIVPTAPFRMLFNLIFNLIFKFYLNYIKLNWKNNNEKQSIDGNKQHCSKHTCTKVYYFHLRTKILLFFPQLMPFTSRKMIRLPSKTHSLYQRFLKYIHAIYVRI